MTRTEKKKYFEGQLSQTASFIVLILSGFITLAVLAILTFACNYGYDLTDESYYVLLIQHYQAYKYTLSQFGFIYQPVAKILSYNIPHLRIFNILVTYLLSLGTLGLFYFSINRENISSPRIKVLTFLSIAGISTSSLLYFSIFNWLPTPSYNSLNLQGILLTVFGLLIVLDSKQIFGTLGGVVMSLGGWLVFMAKPTSALLLGILCFIALLLNKKISLRLVLTLVFTLITLFSLTTYSLDTGFIEYFKRYQIAFEGQKLLASGHDGASIWRIDFPELSKKEWAFFSIASILIASLVCFLRKVSCTGAFASFICILAFIIYAAACYKPFASSVFYLPRYAQLQILSVPVGVLSSIFGYFIYSRSIPKINKSIWWAVICILLPYIYAFGTGCNYFYASSAAAFFWLLAAIAMLSAIDISWMKNSLLPLAFISQLVTTIFLLNAVESPYRQPNKLLEEARSVEINNSESNIRVNINVAKYIEAVRQVGISGNITYDDSIIDLTGSSPGIAVILGTFNLGLPWALGGYPGSNQMALFFLEKTQLDQIRKAWVITEPLGKRSLSEDILSNWGLTLINDYELVGEVLAPAGYRGSRNPTLQKIYKPKKQHRAANSF
jgi:hypothetical protein